MSRCRVPVITTIQLFGGIQALSVVNSVLKLEASANLGF